MTWRVAESLKTLRSQINAMFPNRDKKSDGSIGDEEHASRASDHNPWIKDSKGQGVVSAMDITHDPKSGMDCHWLTAELVKSRDPRIKYIIWNRRITSPARGWVWGAYSGKNSHNHHLHISVNAEPKYYDSQQTWALNKPQAAPKPAVKLIDDDIDILEIPKDSAAVPVSNPQQTSQHSPAQISGDTPLQASNEQPPNPDAAAETKVISTTQETGTVTEKLNEQDVNLPATVEEPEPQGFLKKLGAGLASLLGGTLTYDSLGKFSGIQFSKETVYLFMFVILLGFFGFCVWAVLDTIKKNKRTELEVLANTDKNRKDLIWVKKS